MKGVTKSGFLNLVAVAHEPRRAKKSLGAQWGLTLLVAANCSLYIILLRILNKSQQKQSCGGWSEEVGLTPAYLLSLPNPAVEH